MRFSTILVIGLIILWSVNIASAQLNISPNMDLIDNDHYLIAGHVYEPYSQDNVVTLTNTKTNEWITVIATEGEDGIKEYLFNLANLHQGWTYNDTFIINYGSEFINFKIIKDSRNYQQDIQRPDNVDPIFIFTGFLIIAVGSGYFYMKKKKNNKEEIIMNETNTKQTIQNNTRTTITLLLAFIAAIIGIFYGFKSGYFTSTEGLMGIAFFAGIYYHIAGFLDACKNNPDIEFNTNYTVAMIIAVSPIVLAVEVVNYPTMDFASILLVILSSMQAAHKLSKKV